MHCGILPVFVEFYAPWYDGTACFTAGVFIGLMLTLGDRCGHCQKLQRPWENAAKSLLGKVKVAAIGLDEGLNCCLSYNFVV